MKEFNISETEKAYMAGIVDGEGCIYVDKYKDKRGRKNYTYTPRVKVSLTNYDVPIYLYNTFGGGFHIFKGGRCGRVKDEFIWTLAGRKVRLFLIAILPYLKIKQKQAELSIKFSSKIRGSQRNKITGYFTPLSRIEFEEREKFYTASRCLNQGGSYEST